MGCLFGARLSPHANLTLIGGWPEQIAALRLGRLRIVHPGGRTEYASLQATSHVETAGPVDVALILTKSPRTEAAARSAALILKPQGIAVTLQNGLGNDATLAAHVGAHRTTMGVTTEGAAVEGPGVLRFGGSGVTTLATHPAVDPAIRALADLFNRAGLDAEVVDDVSGLVWGKLAVNAAINPLTALLRVPNGVLLESEQARSLLADAAREVAAVAAAKGITLPFADPAAQAEAVAERTAANRSSMLQDVLRGVETEIEAICGAVAREGAALGVETPVNATLYRLVRAVEEQKATNNE